MTMSIEHDAPGVTSSPVTGIAWRPEERLEHRGPVVADAREQLERHAGATPPPGHVERAAAREHEIAAQVDIERQRPQERERVRCPGAHDR